MSTTEQSALTEAEQICIFAASVECNGRRDAKPGPFGELVPVLSQGDVSRQMKPEEQHAAFQAAVKCCTDDIDAGPFNDFVSLLARRVMANVYK